MLQKLKEKGYTMAALTDLPSAMPDEIFRRDISELLGYFDYYVSSTVAGYRKPNCKAYNPAFRAHISSKGKLPVPVGYYLMIKPGNQSFLVGGLFADMFKDATTMVQDYITKNSGEWEKTIHEPDFEKYFTVQGTALKRVPAGYEKEHPQADYLKFKSWYAEYPLRDEDVIDAEIFPVKAAEFFRIMKPFNDYLNKALADFQMPAR